MNPAALSSALAIRLCLGFILVMSVASGALLMWRRKPPFLDRPRSLRLLLQLSIGLLGILVAIEAARGVLSRPSNELLPMAWIALAATVAAALLCLRNPAVTCSVAPLYWLGLIAIGIAWVQRGYWPGRFFVWGALCDLAGWALVAALIGWSWPLLRASGKPPLDQPSRRSFAWFGRAPAGLIGVTAVLTAWIAVDFAFERTGGDLALFGLAGRAAAGPAALMLVGATILMAWQSDGAWRRGWQYAAMATGVLFTSSVGWARMDPGLANDDSRVWLARTEVLLVSTAMMTFLTRIGLARFLPAGSDWIDRGRRAAPIFAALALILLALVLIQRARL
jgi:hypothetical protein